MSEHGYCDKCGKPLEDHPTVNVEGIDSLALCQERAIKWVKVEPGTVIPAGQPYRMEFAEDGVQRVTATATEYFATEDRAIGTGAALWFVDSSWKPPLVLPTEPTWGIAVHVDHPRVRTIVDRCHVDAGDDFWHSGGTWRAHNVADFIPLTDEQIQRIEAAR